MASYLGAHEETWSSGCEELESDVNQMAQQILEFRRSPSEQLKRTLTSVLAAQRPIVLEISDPGPSEAPNPDAAEDDVLGGANLLSLEDPETGKKIQMLKEKISSNVSAMPVVLKRIKECMARIEKLDSYNPCIQILKDKVLAEDLPSLLEFEEFPFYCD